MLTVDPARREVAGVWRGSPHGPGVLMLSRKSRAGARGAGQVRETWGRAGRAQHSSATNTGSQSQPIIQRKRKQQNSPP